MTEFIMKEKWLTKKFPLMPYCVLAIRFLELMSRNVDCLMNFRCCSMLCFLNEKWQLAMTECHVQLIRNVLIGIQTLNLMITSTRHYPIEPLTFLNCMKPHSNRENVY